METFEEIVADRKRWKPYRKSTFAGIESFNPKTIDEVIADSNKITALRRALESILKIAEESDMPPAILRSVIRRAVTLWAEENDSELLAYLFLNVKLGLVLTRANRATGKQAEKLKAAWVKLYPQFVELQKRYRPAEAIMDYWNFFK